MVNEHASINYSPDSLTQFNALAQLAQEGLIPNTSSIRGAAVRSGSVPGLPGHDAIRLGAIAAVRSGSCVTPLDNNTTNNALVQQATLPSTGATTHANYQNWCHQQHLYL